MKEDGGMKSKVSRLGVNGYEPPTAKMSSCHNWIMLESRWLLTMYQLASKTVLGSSCNKISGLRNKRPDLCLQL